MKHLNKFDALSPEDRQFVLNLCEAHSYAKAAELLYEDRPVGLSLITSASALCRFYTSHHPEAHTTTTLGQFSAAIRARGQAHASGHVEAILVLTENRILEALKAGRPLAELAADFRMLKSVHRAFLDEKRWRQGKTPEQQQRDYREHIERAAQAPAPDFIDAELDEDPGALGVEPDDFFDQETEDLLLLNARRRLALRREALEQERQQRISALAAAASANHPPGPQANGVAQHSTSFHQKSPAIPPIPPKKNLEPHSTHPEKDSTP